MRGIRSVNDPEQEIERLGEVLVPYLCERTGLQLDEIERVLDAIETFWDAQPGVVGIMFINGVPIINGPPHEI